MNYYNDFYDGLNDTRNILCKQIDTVAILNKLYATLTSEIQNIDNYKINIVGNNVYINKRYLKELRDCLKEYKEKIEQLIKIKNGFPIFNLSDIENISQIKTLPSIDFKFNVITDNLEKEIKIIVLLIEEAILSAQKENDYQTISILSNLLFLVNQSLIDIPR